MISLPTFESDEHCHILLLVLATSVLPSAEFGMRTVIVSHAEGRLACLKISY